MDEQVAWLRAQLDEDERLVQLQPPWPWHLNAEGDEVWAADDELVADAHALSGNQQRNTAAHIARHDPARALREVEAKRRIVAHIATVALSPWPISVASSYVEDLERILHLLALPYADRPGYRDEWRP